MTKPNTFAQIGICLCLSACLYTPLQAQNNYSNNYQTASNDDYKPANYTPHQVMEGYKYRVEMYDDVTQYYIMPNDEVYGKNASGNIVHLGYRETSRRDQTGYLFTFTLLLQPPQTIGVDRYGHAWQYGTNYRQIVANVIRVK